MRAAVNRVDVVGEGIDRLGKAVVVLERDFNRGVAHDAIDGDRVGMDAHAILIEVAHE